MIGVKYGGCHFPRLVGAAWDVGGGEELDPYLEWLMLLASFDDWFAKLDDVSILENVGSGRRKLCRETSRRGNPSTVMASTVGNHNLSCREKKSAKAQRQTGTGRAIRRRARTAATVNLS